MNNNLRNMSHTYRPMSVMETTLVYIKITIFCIVYLPVPPK